jgi:hypothetical protein
MTDNGTKADNGTDIEKRSRRALTEAMSVVTVDGFPVDGETVVCVISSSGNSYTVDIREGRCECRDIEYNLPDGDREVCKHVERARVATGAEPIDATVVQSLGTEIDDQLGANASGPVVATSDGGAVTEK